MWPNALFIILRVLDITRQSVYYLMITYLVRSEVVLPCKRSVLVLYVSRLTQLTLGLGSVILYSDCTPLVFYWGSEVLLFL